MRALIWWQACTAVFAAARKRTHAQDEALRLERARGLGRLGHEVVERERRRVDGAGTQTPDVCASAWSGATAAPRVRRTCGRDGSPVVCRAERGKPCSPTTSGRGWTQDRFTCMGRTSEAR